MYLRALETALSALAAFLAIPTLTLLLEIVAARPGRSSPKSSTAGRPRVAVLVPAHNEEVVIERTLRSVIPQLEPADRLLVVADNCSDSTALIASRAGAEVISRTDPVHRGKGYALDHGIRHLAQDAPEIVIIVDADCIVERAGIGHLAREAARNAAPVQALYMMDAPSGAGLGLRMAQFAWALKNRARPLGLQTLGLPCQLMGTGMAFPWTCISTAPLATGHIVEDLRLGIDLAVAGRPPLFCEQALVYSRFPVSADGVRTQRTRWEHGHLKTILEQVPRILYQSLARRDMRLAAMGIDLAVPPLALLGLWIGGVWTASLLGVPFGMGQRALIMASGDALAFGIAVGLAWWRFGRNIVSATDLALAPAYALAKVPLYLRFLFNPQSRWVRSSRHQDP